MVLEMKIDETDKQLLETRNDLCKMVKETQRMASEELTMKEHTLRLTMQKRMDVQRNEIETEFREENVVTKQQIEILSGVIEEHKEILAIEHENISEE